MPSSRRNRTTAVTCPVCQATHTYQQSNQSRLGDGDGDRDDLDGVGLVVYVTSTCPICLEEHTPLIALGCGHAFCREDFERVRDKRRRRRSTSSLSETSTEDDDDEEVLDLFDSSDGESGIESGDEGGDTSDDGSGEEDEDDNDIFRGSSGSSSSSSSSSSDDAGLSNAIARMVRAEVERQLRLQVDARLGRPSEEGEAQADETTAAVASAPDLSSSSRGDLGPSEGRGGRDGREERGDEGGEVALLVLRDDTGELWRVTPADQELVTSQLYRDLGRLVGTDGRGGAWIQVYRPQRQDDCWQLVHVSSRGRVRRTGNHFPTGSEIVVDGKGGVWCLVDNELWRCDRSREFLMNHVHPRSKLIGDGHGGVWNLRPLVDDVSEDEDEDEDNRGDVWEMWHVNRRRQRMVHHYPRGTKVAGGGVAGCRSFWALTPAGELWYADLDHEYLMYSYPPDSRIADDGMGGVWVHRRTCRGWKLWHADRTRERSMYRCRHDSKVVGDGRGGAWILQQDGGQRDVGGGGGGDRTWSLWHATMDSYRKVHDDFPRNAQLASAL